LKGTVKNFGGLTAEKSNRRVGINGERMNISNESNKKYGTVKRFLDAGYGFLVCEEIERDVFFHSANWRSAETPVVGRKVIFELAPGRVEGQGQQAINVHPIKEDAVELGEIGTMCVQGGVQ
jgi:cold shock CspA family protein